MTAPAPQTRIFALVLVGLALAACRAPEEANRMRWTRPDTQETQQFKDEGECRRMADAEVNREARRGAIFTDDALMRPGSFDASMSRYEAARRIERLAAECLRRRGYVPAPK